MTPIALEQVRDLTLTDHLRFRYCPVYRRVSAEGRWYLPVVSYLDISLVDGTPQFGISISLSFAETTHFEI